MLPKAWVLYQNLGIEIMFHKRRNESFYLQILSFLGTCCCHEKGMNASGLSFSPCEMEKYCGRAERSLSHPLPQDDLASLGSDKGQTTGSW